MPDTIQVVRVDWAGAYTDGEVVKVEVAGVNLVVPVGDVIELTEHVEYADEMPILHHYRSPEEPVENTDA